MAQVPAVGDGPPQRVPRQGLYPRRPAAEADRSRLRLLRRAAGARASARSVRARRGSTSACGRSLALASDYRESDREAQVFFAKMQNKMHYAATSHRRRASFAGAPIATKPNMGLTSWSGDRVLKRDVVTAKNYLDAEEMDTLNRIVVLVFLDRAEFRAQRRKDIRMADWETDLDKFLADTGASRARHRRHHLARRRDDVGQLLVRRVRRAPPDRGRSESGGKVHRRPDRHGEAAGRREEAGRARSLRSGGRSRERRLDLVRCCAPVVHEYGKPRAGARRRDSLRAPTARSGAVRVLLCPSSPVALRLEGPDVVDSRRQAGEGTGGRTDHRPLVVQEQGRRSSPSTRARLDEADGRRRVPDCAGAAGAARDELRASSRSSPSDPHRSTPRGGAAGAALGIEGEAQGARAMTSAPDSLTFASPTMSLAVTAPSGPHDELSRLLPRPDFALRGPPGAKLARRGHNTPA